MKNLPKNYKIIFYQLLIFVALFIVISGIIGPWVISTKLLYGFNFFIYGNLGKLVLFSTIIFFFLTRDQITKVKTYSYTKLNILYILGALLLIPVFFQAGKILLNNKTFTNELPLSILTHGILISIPIMLALGVFGYSFLKTFFKEFKKEAFICIGLSVVLFAAIFQVWKLWPLFSMLVLNVEYFFYSHLYSNVYVIPPRTLFVKNFAVEIAEACSGLESIFLFTVLYIFIAFVDWKKLNKKKIIFSYPLLLVGLVFVNILRVFLLIMSGILINPKVMVTLFHTYLGMILFIIYFLAFLKFGYGWMKAKNYR